MRALTFDAWTTGHPKGTYHVVNTTALQRSIRVACPECGRVHALNGHHITPEGEVTPPILCACGFNEQVQLVGWTEPRVQVPTATRRTR